MSIAENNITQLVEDLGDDAKLELLEHLAGELGFDLTEQADPVDPQTDILDIAEEAIRTLESDLNVLKAQFAEGAELEYEALDQVSDSIESVISGLLETHDNLNALIDAVFDVDDEDDTEEDEE